MCAYVQPNNSNPILCILCVNSPWDMWERHEWWSRATTSGWNNVFIWFTKCHHDYFKAVRITANKSTKVHKSLFFTGICTLNTQTNIKRWGWERQKKCNLIWFGAMDTHGPTRWIWIPCTFCVHFFSLVQANISYFCFQASLFQHFSIFLFFLYV